MPTLINQLSPSTCSPLLYGASAAATGTTVLSSQFIVYTAPGAVVGGQGTVRPQIISLVLYSGAGCTGTVLAIQSTPSSTTTCQALFILQGSPSPSNVIFYQPTASASNPATVLAALNSILPTTQAASLSSLFQINAFYSSQAGCQGQTSSALQMVAYKVTGTPQGVIGTCAAPVYAATTASPTYFNNALCTTTTSATANNIAQLQFFTDSACATPAIDVNAYQAGVCVVTGASSSMNYVQTTVSGTTSLIMNTFTNNACTGTATSTTLASLTAATATTNCAIAPAWTGYSGYYCRYTQQTTLGTTLTGTANTGTANSVTWAAQYNTQAGCSASTVATGAVYQGAIATCLPFTAQSPTSTPTAPAVITSGSFVSQTVSACSVPNPTYSPTASPSIAPSFNPTVAAVSTASVSTALSSSGAAVTASLAAAYPGISVSNAVTSTTSTGVSATQNIPTGVTVAQAQTAAFQAQFTLVRCRRTSLSLSQNMRNHRPECI